MLNVVLFEPEIPPNTGNIIRLCAATGTILHLIEPLGFQLNDKQLKRAGLDYEMLTPLKRYSDFQEWQKTVLNRDRIFLVTTKARQCYTETQYRPSDSFIFGPETRGLPNSVLSSYHESQKIRLPMVKGARSLNLSNSVAITLFEALRQLGFPDLN
jgi:tRNA (cytidine/uridine-2'-O-)-methyltransferase